MLTFIINPQKNGRKKRPKKVSTYKFTVFEDEG